ncbi:MAG: glycogen/starch/alpha-glucan phosphorylase [Kiritimatiellae bacterium]|nr:glycogen/starch/alpha-glucan phosphorylase [Kiritimatiellia bacterium]
MQVQEKNNLANEKRVQMNVDGLKYDFLWHLRYTQAKAADNATRRDEYQAFAYCVRDRIVERWVQTQAQFREKKVRRAYYLSLEFLIGRLLGNNVINMKMDPVCEQALADYGIDWHSLRDFEVDAALGNGGLGRLAACFLDSMSTLGIPGMGYGLRYDYGIFRQRIVDGKQVEEPDNWLKLGYPWEIERPERTQVVHFGGRIEHVADASRTEWHWVETDQVIGIPYDLPIVGYSNCVNTLRLWSAKAVDEFQLDDFNQGSYVAAVENKVLAENLTKVLYPNDNVLAGKELRLRQQYFFVACSLQDILDRFVEENGKDWSKLPEKVFIQLNETHPALIIPEMIRLLVDIEGLKWDTAWNLTRACTAYTNHTILPEALETWSVSLMKSLLPRHMQIIYEINGRFLKNVALKWPGDLNRLASMSIIAESGERSVRMANLAIVGSSAVNGVAALHSEIIKNTLFKDFYDIYPSHFSNKTNGITPRRWLLKANPGLADLITQKIGTGWVTQLDELRKLEEFTTDAAFLHQFRAIKQSNKTTLAAYIQNTLGIEVLVDSIFDVQVKRMHEYKRQLLLVLYVIVLYNRLIEDPDLDIVPRTFIIAGKAAPGYTMAKLIIELIHGVAEVINSNPRTCMKLRLVFMPDYRVSLAEKIIPAANVSEQISLAGTEASGTGNMKLMLNGALTIGTLDGATVEMREEVGEENIFIFGLRAHEVDKLRPSYLSTSYYHNDPEIRMAIDMIRRNVFSLLNPGLFTPIIKSLLDYNDHYMLLADLRDYIETQDKIDKLYRDTQAWDQMALLNVARAGKFSSDRTIAEYAKEIWKIEPFALQYEE